MTKQEAIKQGAKYLCIKCLTPYVHLPKYWEDQAGCEGAWLTQCRHCDNDLIVDIKKFDLLLLSYNATRY